jgi:acetylornithine deacetylase
MSTLESAVAKWAEEHRDEIVGLLQRLVTTPSIVGAEGACQAIVAESMGGCCDTVDTWEPDAAWLDAHPVYFHKGTSFAGRPNVVGVRKGRGRGPSLILNAHIDVVDPGPEETWTHGPWSGVVEGGRLYGRGAADDKAGTAVMLCSARCLRELGVQLGGDLILESVVDEEWGGGGSLATLHRGYRADAAIVFEPSSLDLCPGSRGGMAFRIRIHGKGAHPVRSYEGISALEKALPIVVALRELERERQARLRTPLFERYPVFAPIVIGKIMADRVPAKVPERCDLEGIMGYPPAETYGDARRDLETCVALAAARDPWLREHPPTVEWLGLNKEGAETPVGDPFVAALRDIFLPVLGRPPIVAGFPAGCDLPYFRRQGNIPSVVFGPGYCGICHSSNEYVPIQEVVDAVKIVTIAAIRWCQVS